MLSLSMLILATCPNIPRNVRNIQHVRNVQQCSWPPSPICTGTHMGQGGPLDPLVARQHTKLGAWSLYERSLCSHSLLRKVSPSIREPAWVNVAFAHCTEHPCTEHCSEQPEIRTEHLYGTACQGRLLAGFWPTLGPTLGPLWGRLWSNFGANFGPALARFRRLSKRRDATSSGWPGCAA